MIARLMAAALLAVGFLGGLASAASGDALMVKLCNEARAEIDAAIQAKDVERAKRALARLGEADIRATGD